jgi:hypothetical protein
MTPERESIKPTAKKCEWEKNCRRKVTHHGHHWGCVFYLCSIAAKKANRHYEVHNGEPR